VKKLKNKFELKIYAQLKKSRARFTYEGTRIPYVLSGHYIPDFVITTHNGMVYIETKGYLRPEHKRKMVAVRRQHPEIDLRILFYAPNKSYIKWAEKNGIKYAISVIPQEWLDGF
jgi:predicted nuclease of restriction endonuclease-like RecB superfamily